MAVVFNGQNNINNQQNQGVTSSGFAQPSTGAAPSQGASPAVNSMNNAQKSNAGRFTNLKSYIGANQGADQNYASRINQNLNQGFNQQKDEANTNAEAVRQGIQNSQNALNQVNQINQQLTGQNATQNALGLGQDQRNLVSNTLGGYAVNQDQLTQQQQAAQAAQANAANMANQNLQNLSSEQGRGNLIQQNLAKGNTGYSLGQKRLDNLFLQAGGSNAVSGLLDSARQNQTVANQLGSQVGDYQNQLFGQGDTKGIIGQEQDLMSGLQGNLGNLQSQYITNLMGTKDSVNAARDAERAKAIEFYNALQSKFNPGAPASGGNVSTMPVGAYDQFSAEDKSKYLGMLGLQSGQNVYDVFNKYTDPNQLFNTNTANANTINDLANQQNVNEYYNLYNLANRKATQDPTGTFSYVDASKTDPNLQITGPSQLGSAVSANANLAADIATRQNEFNQAAGQYDYNSPFYNGYSHDANAKSLYDYLNSNNQANPNLSFSELVNNNATTGLNRIGSVDGFDLYKDAMLGGTYRSGVGGAQAANTGYTQWHREKAYNDLMNYLKGQGAFNKV